jgi:hypothetical protein
MAAKTLSLAYIRPMGGRSSFFSRTPRFSFSLSSLASRFLTTPLLDIISTMKSITSGLAFVFAAITVAGAVQVPESECHVLDMCSTSSYHDLSDCLDGTFKLVNSTMVEGKEHTVHTCKLKPQTGSSAARGPANGSSLARHDKGSSLTGRDNGYDMCGHQCTTFCNSGTGGPNPYGEWALPASHFCGC